MSWWDRKSKRRDRNQATVRLPRIEDDALPKISDPNCIACYVENKSDFDLTFVSQLEMVHPLEEAPAFKRFELKPGESKLIPHGYFDILPHDAERKVLFSAIPKDHPPVEFLYKRKAPIAPGSDAADPRSQAADHGMPS